MPQKNNAQPFGLSVFWGTSPSVVSYLTVVSLQNETMSRVFAYIDGFNLYYGLRQRGWRQFYWIDPCRMVKALLAPGEQLVGCKYFTARVREPDDKRERQDALLSALDAVSDLEVVYGRFYRKQRSCRNCGNAWMSYEEKMTDSAIAAHLVADAFRNQFDTAYLIGGDTDIVPAVKIVRRWLPKKRMVACYPPARRNDAVGDVCDDSGQINGRHLEAAVMETPICLEDGVVIQKPKDWR